MYVTAIKRGGGILLSSLLGVVLFSESLAGNHAASLSLSPSLSLSLSLALSLSLSLALSISARVRGAAAAAAASAAASTAASVFVCARGNDLCVAGQGGWRPSCSS